jgi:transcriptional regulator with XRE-family HTH domain
MASETVPAKRKGRPAAPVDANSPGGRLRALRELKGMDQEALAAVLGVDRTMVTRYENGKYDMGPEILRRAASHFATSASQILFGEQIEIAHRRAPIVGQVGAGAEVEAIQDTNPELVEIPADFEDGQAFRVTGDSCLPVFEQGDILVVRGASSVAEGDFLGRFCVVETSENLGYVKRVIKGASVPGQGQLYTLESPNADDIPNVQLKRVRPIAIRILRRR